MAISNARTGYLNGTTSGWSARSIFYLNGAWYLVALDTSAVKIRVYKAADGLAWVEQDAANAVTHAGATLSYGAGAPLSGTSAGKIHVAYRTATNTLWVRIFDTSTDTWAGSDVGGASVWTAISGAHSVDVAVRSDGDVIVLCRHSGLNAVYYSRYEGSSWSSLVAINATLVGVPLSAVMTANSDMCHFFFYEETANDVTTRSLDSSNSLGTAVDIDASASTVVPRGGNFGGYVLDGATHRISYMVWDSGGEFDFAYSTSNNAPVFAVVGNLSPTSTTDPGSMGGAVVPFDRGWHTIWSGDGRGEIHKDFSDDYASPTFTTDTNVITGLGNDPAVYAASAPTGVLVAYTNPTTPSVDSIWAVGAPASSHYVGNIGTDTYNSTSTNTRTITLTGGASVGQTVVIYSECNGSATLTGITDSQGNTWSSTVQVNNGSNHGVQLTHGHITNALSASDTITLTWSASGATRISRAEVFSGLDTASSWDVSNTATASAASISAATGTLAQAAEMIFTIAGTTADTGHVFLANQVKLGEQVTAVGSNDRWTAASYQEVNATTSVTSGILFSASRTAALATATLKIATGGGSATFTSPLAAVALSAKVPTYTASAVATTPLAAIALSAKTPSINVALTSPVAALTLAALTPTYTAAAVYTSPKASLTLAALTPSATAVVSVASPLATITLSPKTPSFSVGVVFTSPLAALALSAKTPSFSAAVTFTSPLAALTLAALTPSFSSIGELGIALDATVFNRITLSALVSNRLDLAGRVEMNSLSAQVIKRIDIDGEVHNRTTLSAKVDA